MILTSIKNLLGRYYSFIYGKEEGTLIGLTGADFRILQKAVIQSRTGVCYDPALHTPILYFFGLHKRSVARLEALGMLSNMAPASWVTKWDWYDITEGGLLTWHAYRLNEFGNLNIKQPFYKNEGH